jgi:hypothetical protein
MRMRDPLYHDPDEAKCLSADQPAMRILMRVQWLKLATGALALAFLCAVWIAWRWG